jgi:hypothetical protein
MLTNSQLQTLKSDIAAKTQAGQPLAGLNPNNADHAFAIAAYYNANASPSFWVWKNSISSEKTGMVVDLSEVGGLTTIVSRSRSLCDLGVSLHPTRATGHCSAASFLRRAAP